MEALFYPKECKRFLGACNGLNKEFIGRGF